MTTSEDIAAVKARYCMAPDLCAGDPDAARRAMAELFTVDAIGEYGADPLTGSDAIAGFLTSAIAANSEWMLHMLHTPLIEAEGAAVVMAHPRLDVLINNAGLHMGEIARGFAGMGLASYNPATAYGITQAALNLFTHAMATQFGAAEIRSVAISPGLIQTEAARSGVEDANWERLKAMQQVKRQGTAEDIANLGVFLASNEGSFINSQVVPCDGGNAMRGFRL